MKITNDLIYDDIFNQSIKTVGTIPFLDGGLMGILISNTMISGLNFQLKKKIPIERMELWLLTTGELIEVKTRLFFGTSVCRVINKRNLTKDHINEWNLNDVRKALVGAFQGIFLEDRKYKKDEYDHAYGTSITYNDFMRKFLPSIVILSYIVAEKVNGAEALQYFGTDDRLEIIIYIQNAIYPSKFLYHTDKYNRQWKDIETLIGKEALEHVMDNIESYHRIMDEGMEGIPLDKREDRLNSKEYNLDLARRLYIYFINNIIDKSK